MIRWGKRKTLGTVVAAASAGAVAGLGQAPVSMPFITLIALGAGLALHLRTETVRQASWTAWGFGFGYFVLTLHWIVEPFLVDVARHGWMAPFALAFLAGGLALLWAGAGALSFRFARVGVAGAITWATALAAAELLRSYLLTGFPWALIGHVWVGWAPMQLAAWIGPHGLTYATLLLPALVVALWGRWLWFVMWAVLPAVGLWVWGAMALVPAEMTDKTVRLIQPNAPQQLKWHPDHVLTFFERAVDLSRVEGDARPDLIVWPETSVPALLSRAEFAMERISAATDGVPVVLGIQRRDGLMFHNSLVVLGADGQIGDIYDKHHLVPFGEYIPAGNVMARFGIGAFAAQQGNGYSPGPGARLLDFGPLGRALPLICYEAIFPQDVNAAPERPDWLLQITNDAWFGQWVGPYQHLAQARLRAVEQGLPLVRAANTGVSAVIDAQGRVTAELALNEAGALDAVLPAPLSRTLYAHSGDLPILLLYLVILGASALRGRSLLG